LPSTEEDEQQMKSLKLLEILFSGLEISSPSIEIDFFIGPNNDSSIKKNEHSNSETKKILFRRIFQQIFLFVEIEFRLFSFYFEFPKLSEEFQIGFVNIIIIICSIFPFSVFSFQLFIFSFFIFSYVFSYRS
jgi:uncharacterized Tic20 family protein